MNDLGNWKPTRRSTKQKDHRQRAVGAPIAPRLRPIQKAYANQSILLESIINTYDQ